MSSTPREVRLDGDTVRRPRKPWTPTVHALLRHLRSLDLPVPEPLAIDERYEDVSLVPGLDGDEAWPHGVSPEGARSLGRLLRAIHEGTRNWTPPENALWSVPGPPSPTICHGDPKPANVAWRDGVAAGLFDWDAARPGDPAEDLAYALLWTVPVEADPGPEPPSAAESAARRERAAALLDGYGWTAPFDVVDAAVTRHEQAICEVELLGERGHEPHATWVRQGWPAAWRSRLGAMRAAGRRTFPAETSREAHAMLLLLDLDNTLVDRDRAFADWAAEFVPAHGGTAEDLDWLLSTDSHGYTHRAVLADGLLERLSLTASRDELVHTLLHEHADHVRCYDGVLEQLRELRRDGHVLVVVTNGTIAQQERKMQVSGLAGVADRVVISEAVGARKPAPEIFAAALDGWEMDSLPWMVGDRAAADVVGGQAAGCRTAWVSHGERWDDGAPPTVQARTTLEALERIVELELAGA